MPTNSSGLTVVAFHGEKPRPLRSLLERLQETASSLVPAVVARPVDEVHATLLGVRDVAEGATRSSVGDVDRATLERLARFLVGVEAHLRTHDVRVGFGGYAAAVDYGITSRGRGLHERSVGIEDGRLVLVGWPWEDGHPGVTLDRLRRSAGRYGFQHRYHAHPSDVDPDAYMVIGDVQDGAPVPEDLVPHLRHVVETSPASVPLTPEDLWVVAFLDDRLPPDTSDVVPLGRFIELFGP